MASTQRLVVSRPKSPLTFDVTAVQTGGHRIRRTIIRLELQRMLEAARNAGVPVSFEAGLDRDRSVRDALDAIGGPDPILDLIPHPSSASTLHAIDRRP